VISRWSLCVLTTAGALCALSACGDDSESDDPRALAERTIAIRATDPGADEVRVEAPASIPAGLVNIRLENRGRGLHDAHIFKVDGRRSARDVALFVEAHDYDPKPKWLHPRGGVAAIRAGEAATVTQVLQPGTYFIADTQENGGDFLTNAAKGGVAKLRVTGTTSATLPTTPGRITARDDGFVATGIEAGTHQITFRNAGREFHQVVAFRIRDGVPFEKGKQEVLDDQGYRATRWMPVYVDSSHATTVIEGGAGQIAELSLAPGTYVLLCFAQDRKGGAPHASRGVASKLVVE
jgi:hypothetical protein